MAQLVERVLSIPEVRGLNQVIGKNLYIEQLFNVKCIEKTKIKEKEAGNGPLEKTFLTMTKHIFAEPIYLPFLEQSFVAKSARGQSKS